MPLIDNAVSTLCMVWVQMLKRVEKLKSRNFSTQMDDPTVRDSESLLLTYVLCIYKGEFSEKMSFSKSLDSTSTATDTYIYM